MRESIEAASQRLLALAAGLAHQSGIRVEISDSSWAWNVQNHVLQVARDSIVEHGVERCFGYVAHEIGHCLISRYPDFDLSGWPGAITASILNAIEDPRVETFMAQRFPGVKPWINQIYAQSQRAELTGETLARAPYSALYVLGCIEEYHNDWQAVGTPYPGVVAQALAATRHARQQYAQTLPLADFSAQDDSALAFAQEVRPRLDDPSISPDHREMAIYVSAWRAFHIAQSEILPSALSLHLLDVHRAGRVLDGDTELRGKIERILGNPLAPHVALTNDILRTTVMAVLERATDSGPVPSARSRVVAERLLNALREDKTSAPPYGLPRPMASAAGHAGESEDPWSGRGSVPPSRSPPTRYEAIREKHAAAIDRLTTDIETVLQPRRHPQVKSGYASGVRLDMRKAMAFEADPRQYVGLWQRTRLPDRTDLAMFLLVDLSGSMGRDGKDDAAVAGSIIMLETLSRMPHVRWAAAGFQDEIIPVADFGEGLTLEVRQRVEAMKLEIHDENPGGHNCAEFNDDGPALTAAAEQLLSLQATRHLLIVVSDGGPAGRHSDEEDLRLAVSQINESGIDLIGVGIGEGTGHVREYYPRHLAEVPVSEFPERMGALVRELLTD